MSELGSPGVTGLISEHACSRHSRYTSLVDGQFTFPLQRQPIPDFLIEANQQVRQGRPREALVLLDDVALDRIRDHVCRDSTRVDLLYMVARLLLDTLELEKAVRWCQDLYQRDPSIESCALMAEACGYTTSRMMEGLEYLRGIVKAYPCDPKPLLELGMRLCALGQHTEGMAVLSDAAAKWPNNADVILTQCWHRQYIDGCTRQELFAGFQNWGRLYSKGIIPRCNHDNTRDPNRVLRVGILSPDLRNNAARYTLEPFLNGYDRERFKLYAYGNIKHPDDVTKRMQGAFARFYNIANMSVDSVVDLITADQIDILIEVGGHVRDHSLRIMCHKPAPVQVDLGGICTMGLPQIEYRLTDPLLDPLESSETYVEQLCYLEGGFPAYHPPQESPIVSPLPALKNGFITFGSFCQQLKINVSVVSLWSRVLTSCPNSRLLMKFPAGNDPEVCQWYYDRFDACGVSSDRIDIRGPLSYYKHLELYNNVDIALDTFPFNGSITTLEGLWMGVPILTLVGDCCVSRVGFNVMTRLGLDVFTAHNEEEWVGKAISFAQQIDHLASIRMSLRHVLLRSPLCDVRRFSRGIEDALTKIWRQYCLQ